MRGLGQGSLGAESGVLQRVASGVVDHSSAQAKSVERLVGNGPAVRPRKVALPKMDKRKLDRLIEEATVDAYDESEQAAGFLTMIEDNMSCPFPARVVGELVEVEGFDSKGRNTVIYAICRRSRKKYLVEVTTLEWEGKPPKGAEWIEAYKAWNQIE